MNHSDVANSDQVGEKLVLSPRSGRWRKAWGGAKRNPRIIGVKERAREARHPFIVSSSQVLRCRTLRALGSSYRRLPGVPLRSHPRLYAFTRYAGLEDVSLRYFDQRFFQSVIESRATRITD